MISDDIDGDVGRRGSMSRLPFLLPVRVVKHIVLQCRVLYVWARQRTSSRRLASVTAAKANKDAATEHNIEWCREMVW